MSDLEDEGAPGYAVPALDKALDILELLADRDGGITQSEIAAAVGRTPSQIFRVLATLERRGYIVRDRQAGLYLMSTRMLDLSHRHAPFRGLVQTAMGPMRDLATLVSQSCNLSILESDGVRIIAQVESPADFGYRVRVGSSFPVRSTATGVLLASGARPEVAKQFAEIIDPAIAAAGYVTRPDAQQAGITDVVTAVVGIDGHTIAALTVPYVATTFSAVDSDAVLVVAQRIAGLISDRLRGMAN